MATDINLILKNLFDFYDFQDQTVISVGAGGGQFIEFAQFAKQVIAIDIDAEAIRQLEQRLQNSPLKEKFTLINSDFLHVNTKADVVVFEFCLHEMENPEAAIRHALTLAQDALILDHWPDSEWAYLVDEDEKVSNSWAAIRKFTAKKVQQFDAVQFFPDYEALFQKVHVQGETTISRIRPFKGKTNINIPMSYGFALI